MQELKPKSKLKTITLKKGTPMLRVYEEAGMIPETAFQDFASYPDQGVEDIVIRGQSAGNFRDFFVRVKIID